MKSTILDKTKLVNSVFSKVYKKYDLMNDIMSLGIHRIWKNRFIDWMNPLQNSKLIDVASGSGDIAKLFSAKTKNLSKITCVEPNNEMFEEGKNNLKDLSNINWVKSNAESLPVEDDVYDFYTISYGIRNVTDINKTLKEAYRVLKPGGRFMCLEFSKINNEIINLFYKNYSRLIPVLGKYVVGSSEPYDYLIKSINDFYSQDELIELIKNRGFSNVEYRNLSNGICAIIAPASRTDNPGINAAKRISCLASKTLIFTRVFSFTGKVHKYCLMSDQFMNLDAGRFLNSVTSKKKRSDGYCLISLIGPV